MSTITDQIQSHNSKVFRRLFIKRRQKSDGLFEPNWLDVSEFVIKWGTVTQKADVTRAGRFKFSNLKIVVNNDAGEFSDADDLGSLWADFAGQQRTLFRVETGFIGVTSSGGVFSTTEFPISTSTYDEDLWDVAKWDGSGDNKTVFVGLLSGDIPVSDKNEVTIPIRPLNQIFVDFPAEDIVGYTSTGLTAEQFFTTIRDQTDGAGVFIFQPFFGDTTANWTIDATTQNYAQLNTSGAKDVRGKSVWDVMEKLAEAENKIVYIAGDGSFKFTAATIGSAITQLHGVGSVDANIGKTIKRITRFGPKISNFYSRVQIKFKEEDTSTSFFTKAAAFAVTGSNTVWNLGHRTFSVDNPFIATSTVAQVLGDALFDEVSALPKEIDLSTSFIPGTSVLQRIKVYYDSTTFKQETLWDLNDWDTELTWDSNKGDALRMVGKEFKVISLALNLDSFETKFKGRAI